MNIGSTAAILIITVLMWAPPATAQGDAEKGRQLGFTCLGCHGIEGQRNAYPSFRVPRLGGQERDYIRTALHAYREGSRSHPTMQAHASSLTDFDIEDLLAWFDTFAGARDSATAEMVAGVDAAVICVSCHGLSGAAVVPQPPILAGQHAEYIEHALNQYKDGKRTGNVMVAFAATLSEADIAAISRFYASQDGLETLAE